MLAFKALLVTILLTFTALTEFLSAQNYGAEEVFRLINTGSGAASLGMGGAFTSVANDLSALYWNPAGIAQLEGLNLHLDVTYLYGDEDFFVESGFSTGSNQDYSFSRTYPNDFAISYGGKYRTTSIAAAFGRQRMSLFGSNYEQQQRSVGMSDGPDPTVSASFSTLFNHTFSGGDDEYTVAFSMDYDDRFLVGLSVNFLTGEQIEERTQNSEESGILFPDQNYSLTADRRETTTEKLSGQYLKIGVIARDNHGSIGAYLRPAYKRKSAFETRIESTEILNGTTFHTISEDSSSSEVEIPFEVALGGSIQLRNRFLFATSFTFANYKDTFQVPLQGFRNVLPYPTLRNRAIQSSLHQLRVGGEYALRADRSIRVRGGFILDNQPYTNSSLGSDPVDDARFNGISFGAGYVVGHFRLDAAFLRETGEFAVDRSTGGISINDVIHTEGRFSHNRLIVSLEVHPF
jgi:hypothetical protein